MTDEKKPEEADLTEQQNRAPKSGRRRKRDYGVVETYEGLSPREFWDSTEFWDVTAIAQDSHGEKKSKDVPELQPQPVDEASPTEESESEVVMIYEGLSPREFWDAVPIENFKSRGKPQKSRSRKPPPSR